MNCQSGVPSEVIGSLIIDFLTTSLFESVQSFGMLNTDPLGVVDEI